MKSWRILLSFGLLGVGLAATAAPMAANNVVATVRNVDQKIQEVDLTAGGELIVTARGGTAASIVLSKVNARVLQSQVSALAASEVTTDHRKIVCFMAPPFYLAKLEVAGENGLHLLLTDSSCTQATYTHPRDEEMVVRARELQAELIALGREAMAD